jgi:predicted transposase/invertase (TIGR01784 family)
MRALNEDGVTLFTLPLRQGFDHCQRCVILSPMETIIELVEAILLRRFTQHDREEIRKMFQLHDLRESKVWQEAHQTGIEKGREEGRSGTQRELARRWLARGMSAKEVAKLLDVPVGTVRLWGKAASK